MPESAADARQHARIAALDRWARTEDRSAATQPARDGLDARFAREIDPEGKLDPAERAIRVTALRKAHFARLARLSARSRRAAAAARSSQRDAQAIAAELRGLADKLEAKARAGHPELDTAADDDAGAAAAEA